MKDLMDFITEASWDDIGLGCRLCCWLFSGRNPTADRDCRTNGPMRSIRRVFLQATNKRRNRADLTLARRPPIIL